jgi:hypothetical protein
LISDTEREHAYELKGALGSTKRNLNSVKTSELWERYSVSASLFFFFSVVAYIVAKRTRVLYIAWLIINALLSGQKVTTDDIANTISSVQSLEYQSSADFVHLAHSSIDHSSEDSSVEYEARVDLEAWVDVEAAASISSTSAHNAIDPPHHPDHSHHPQDIDPPPVEIREEEVAAVVEIDAATEGQGAGIHTSEEDGDGVGSDNKGGERQEPDDNTVEEGETEDNRVVSVDVDMSGTGALVSESGSRDVISFQ